MLTPEQILMRKIKKREKKKLALMKKKANDKSGTAALQGLATSKGLCEESEKLPLPKKKKKKHTQDEKTEPQLLNDESENSENGSNNKSNRSNEEPETAVPQEVLTSKGMYEESEKLPPHKKKKKKHAQEENTEPQLMNDESENLENGSQNESNGSNEEQETVVPQEVMSKGSYEENEKLPSHKKKKKKHTQDVTTEPQPLKHESENSESGSQNESNEKENKGPIPGVEVLPDLYFTSLEGKVSDLTLNAVKEMGYTTMTEVQARTIPLVLADYSAMVKSKTGSGKTLAFLIPIVDMVNKVGFKQRNGTGAIILTPTRELAMQTYGVLTELMKYHKQTYGLVMGGGNRSTEAKKLFYGVNILVATPGRLLDHLRNTEGFVYKSVAYLVIDEVDRMLEMGFQQEIRQILDLLPKYRLTLTFSATMSQKAQDLALMALPSKYVQLYVGDNRQLPAISLLKQSVVFVPSEQRLLYLFSFLKCYIRRKIMVFFSTCMSVKFHDELFNYIELPVMSIHGKQDQATRTRNLFKFCNADAAILLCTDIAARGLDIPGVEWVVQYDPPDSSKEYIHRVGRTARGLGTSGEALIFLRSEEIAFLRLLKQRNIMLDKMTFKPEKILDIQQSLEKLISRNDYLRDSATEAFQSYLRAYNSNCLKVSFNYDTLDIKQVAKSFGFKFPPAFKLGGQKKKDRKINPLDITPTTIDSFCK